MLYSKQSMNTDNDVLISVRDLSKKYCKDLPSSLRYGVADIAGEALFTRRGDKAELRSGEFWALQNVSFELKRGETLAIIGRNGSGKSTLLKLLYGLIRPDAGAVVVRGRLGAIIELHSGLDPVLTGRENIYVKAALHGMSRRDIRPIIDDIIDFSELGEFIDSPTQFYSSGMLSRLGFSIAAHLAPDILLIDEVLAVGDLGFQRKCLAHLQKFIARGGSLILVSHNPYQIQSICRRGLLLDEGRVTYSAGAVETLNYYLRQNQTLSGNGNAAEPKQISEKKPLVIDKVAVRSGEGERVSTGGDLEVTVDYRSLKPIENTHWHFSIWTAEGSVCVAGSGLIPAEISEGAGQLRCRVRNVPLTAGDFLTKVAIGIDGDSLYPLAISGWHDRATYFTVSSDSTRLVNTQLAQRQLTVLEVEW
jgi:lipopolysaccharide transport system ATP-binding protein